MEIRYTVNNEKNFWSATKIKDNRSVSYLQVAEKCARDYYKKNGRTGSIPGDIELSKWPKIITLWDEDEVELGDYEVTLGYRPKFDAKTL